MMVEGMWRAGGERHTVVDELDSTGLLWGKDGVRTVAEEGFRELPDRSSGPS